MTPGLGETDMRSVKALDYSDYPVELHTHKHHIFPGNGADHLHLGAEVEFARGCPYACTFCNKTLFRNKFRERELSRSSSRNRSVDRTRCGLHLLHR